MTGVIGNLYIFHLNSQYLNRCRYITIAIEIGATCGTSATNLTDIRNLDKNVALVPTSGTNLRL